MKTVTSHKKKFYLLLLGGLFFFIICYNLAYKKTFSEIRSAKENNRQLASLNDAPLQLQLLDKRFKDLGGIINTGIQSESNLEVLLLEKANSLIKSQNLKITELPKTDSYTRDGFIIKTQQIVIQGSFKELLSFLHSIERDQAIGNICSVDFFSQKDSKTGIYVIKMKIYFQSIIQEKQK